MTTARKTSKDSHQQSNNEEKYKTCLINLMYKL